MKSLSWKHLPYPLRELDAGTGDEYTLIDSSLPMTIVTLGSCL